ncbi:MAG: hypothetical protein PVJ11_16085, partial [Syntrophobacterales bacterium]
MKSESFRKLLCLLLFVVLIPFSSAFADTFTDQGDFEQAVGPLTVIDFEGFATEGGAAGRYELTGDEFAGITLTPDGDAEGLFVGIPDSDVPGDNCDTFYAADFVPVSPVAVFSPDDPLDDCESPIGTLIVDFDTPTPGVGVYFLDVESAVSSIEAFDGPGGTGNSLGILTLQNQGDDSQAFAGVAASGIKSAVIVIGGGTDGVGLDDLQFGKLQVALDIKPTSCPNPLNTKKRGVLPAAILGTENFDVTQIDVSTLRLEGVAPIRWNLEDVATPFEPFIGKELCKRDCSEAG